MKKVILSLVFVFATGAIMNATSSKEEITTTITRTLEKSKDCFGDAWAYGTANGGGDEELEYALTNAYYAGCTAG
jgi:hypothetical protein